MLFTTKGIVLRAVKYGETSLIVSIYTEMFGIQSYIVNGARQSSKKGSPKAIMLQPSAILELLVYHNDLKNLQRIKEHRWGHLYKNILSDVVKNAVALFMVELLQKTIKQPENNPALFYFIEDAFIHLDESDASVVANYPLYFCIHLASFFGFRFSDAYDEQHAYLDLAEGEFVTDHPMHPNFIEGQLSFITSQLLKTMQPHELGQIKLNHETRRALLQAYQVYYALHVPDFGVIKTLPVLQEVLS